MSCLGCFGSANATSEEQVVKKAQQNAPVLQSGGEVEKQEHQHQQQQQQQQQQQRQQQTTTLPLPVAQLKQQPHAPPKHPWADPSAQQLNGKSPASVDRVSPSKIRNDTPAFLAIPPLGTPRNGSPAKLLNGHNSEEQAAEQPEANFSGPPELKHNSPPSFKGFLVDKDKAGEEGEADLHAMQSDDIWKPRNLGKASSLASTGSGAAKQKQDRLTASTLERQGVQQSNGLASLQQVSKQDWEDSLRAQVPAGDVQSRVSSLKSDGSLRANANRAQGPSLAEEGLPATSRSGSLRTADVLTSRNRNSSLGNPPSWRGNSSGETVRESDSGARPLAHTRSGSLSGSPHEPGQVGADLYDLVGQLGVGRTGVTKLMRDSRTNELVAAKWVQHTAGETLSVQTEREIVNHRRLLHPNVVRFREVFATDEHLVIVMDYASVGHLSERIATGGALGEDKAKEMFRQLVDGMAYCHKQGIVHRNLRMENMLLDGHYFRPTLKISGFAYSKAPDLDSAPKTMALGSPAYSPPEMLMATRNEGASYDGRALDVWSAGVILYNMLTGQLPFQDPTEPGVLTRKLMQRIVNCKFELSPDLHLSQECVDLLGSIFVTNPKKRISSYAIQDHPWLAGTPLPKAEPVLISSQTERNISEIMERARKRRAARQAAQKATAKQPLAFNEDLLED